MDITNNLSSDNIQTGGNIDSDISSNSDTSENIQSDDNIQQLYNEFNISKKNFNIDDLLKNAKFNKLNNNQKTLIINKLLENNPKSNKTTKSNVSNKESYLYCKNCGYYEKILAKTLIFRKSNQKIESGHDLNFLNYKYDNTLPNNINYNCINDKCQSHEHFNLKRAVMYKNDNSHNVKYICTVCDSFWNTYNE
jgi:hypothetical protein